MFYKYEYECQHCGERTDESGTCRYCGYDVNEDDDIVIYHTMSDEELCEDDL